MTNRLLKAVPWVLLVAVETGPIAQGSEIAPLSALREAGLAQYWRAELPLEGDDWPTAAYLIEGDLYVTTRLGDLHAVDGDVGLVRWVHRVGARDGRVFRPTLLSTYDGRRAVVATHSQGAYVFERDRGDVLAVIPDWWPAGSAAVGDAFSLYVGSNDGSIHAVQWYNPVHGQPLRSWKLVAGGPVTSMPGLVGGVLYFASQGGGVFACTANWDKMLKWHYFTEAAVVADLLVHESGVYVASLDRSLYRLDLTYGTPLWRIRLPEPLRDPPIFSQRTVYQHCPGAGLYAIDVDTSEILWVRPEGIAFASRRGDRTCIVLGYNRIGVLDSTSGEIQQVIPIPADSLVTANPGGLTLYVITRDGEVGCYTSSEVRHLRADDLLKGLTPRGAGEAGSAESGQEPTDRIEDTSETDLDDPLRSQSDR